MTRHRSHAWERATEGEWGRHDMGPVREWMETGEPKMSDVFGQLHAGLPRAEWLAPFKFWFSSVHVAYSDVVANRSVGLHLMSIDIGVCPLPDRMRADNHRALGAAARRFGDSARVCMEQTHGADGFWDVSSENLAQFPEWCRPWSGVAIPVEIGTCRPGQLAARLVDVGSVLRWPYGSTTAVVVATNLVGWRGALLSGLHPTSDQT